MTEYTKESTKNIRKRTNIVNLMKTIISKVKN